MMKNFKSFFEPGVLSGESTHQLFEDAKNRGYALAAINVVDLHGIHAALEAAAEEKAPIIIQFSYGGSLFLGGQGLCAYQSEDEVAALGAILGAKYVHEVAKIWQIPVVLHTDHAQKQRLSWLEKVISYEESQLDSFGRGLFSSHMIDLSQEPLVENLTICCAYFKRIKRLNQLLEIEIGCTGGEEDGLGRTNLTQTNRLYSDPDDVAVAFEQLSQISDRFTLAASFGNVHGVYAPGNVKLDPALLQRCQEAIAKKVGRAQPAHFVFHGSSGSAVSELKESLQYGVVKVNIDTDTQWAQWEGLLKFYQAHRSRLLTQVGTDNDPTIPNKKFYDPRVWLREVEKGMKGRIQTALRELNASQKCL